MKLDNFFYNKTIVCYGGGLLLTNSHSFCFTLNS